MSPYIIAGVCVVLYAIGVFIWWGVIGNADSERSQ